MVAGNSTSVIILGDVMTDIVVQFHQSIRLGSDTAAGTRVLPGGSGANQATWLAWKGWPEVHFVASVGDDIFGRAHARALRAAGVAPHLATDRHHDTGMIVVLVDTAGERTMITDRGANGGLTPDDLPRDDISFPGPGSTSRATCSSIPLHARSRWLVWTWPERSAWGYRSIRRRLVHSPKLAPASSLSGPGAQISASPILRKVACSPPKTTSEPSLGHWRSGTAVWR